MTRAAVGLHAESLTPPSVLSHLTLGASIDSVRGSSTPTAAKEQTREVVTLVGVLAECGKELRAMAWQETMTGVKVGVKEDQTMALIKAVLDHSKDNSREDLLVTTLLVAHISPMWGSIFRDRQPSRACWEP